MKKTVKKTVKKKDGSPKATSGRKVAHISRLKRARFLAAFSKLGNVTAAAERAGVSRRIHTVWLHDDAYREAFEIAAVEATDRLETEARRRALDGVDEPVYYQGERVDTIKKYSDLLLIFLLKGAKPEKYRERFELSGRGGGPIELSTYVYLPSNGRELDPAQVRSMPDDMIDAEDVKAIPERVEPAGVILPPSGRENGSGGD